MNKPIFYRIAGENGGDIINLAEATNMYIEKQQDNTTYGLCVVFYFVVCFKNRKEIRARLAIKNEAEAREYLKGVFHYLQSESARN